MPDERLSSLRKAWQAAPALEAELAYLGHLKRRGYGTQVELAAHLGHPASRRLLSWPQPYPLDAPEQTIAWLRVVFQHSASTSTKAALVLAESIYLQRHPWISEAGFGRELLRALHDKLQDPSEEHELLVSVECERLAAAEPDYEARPGGLDAAHSLFAAAGIAEGFQWRQLPCYLDVQPSDAAAREIRRVLRERLVPWLLLLEVEGSVLS